MREIKFRGWHKLEKKMCRITTLTDEGAYLVGLKPAENIPVIAEVTNTMIGQSFDETDDGRFCYFADNVIEVMQFTGLKDQNNIEICEGDIVERYDGARGVVGFEQGMFCTQFIPKSITKTGNELYTVEKIGMRFDLKVVGNIYQHPRLMPEHEEQKNGQ